MLHLYFFRVHFCFCLQRVYKKMNYDACQAQSESLLLLDSHAAPAEGAGPSAQRRSAHFVGSTTPRAVTRGEKDGEVAKVDWLNFTLCMGLMTMTGVVALIGRFMDREIELEEGAGFLGFTSSYRLFARHGSTRSPIGFFAFGGDSQKGRCLVSLSGSGCAFIRDWASMAQFLDDSMAKITRLDLAVDFLNGEHSVEDAVAVYQCGGFSLGKNSPSSRLDGDWLNGVAGKSLYVGKAQNGKMLRVYEKGRQLGDPASEWTRFEVQLGSRDRTIPFQALIDRDRFFAGCYPALADLIQSEGTRIATDQVKARTSLAHLLGHLRRCYGKTIDALIRYADVNYQELVQEIRVFGLPSRVEFPAVEQGVRWSDVLDQSKRIFQL